MKKSEFVSSKISPETKAKLEEIAKRKEWTLSHTINRILEDYSENQISMRVDHSDTQIQKGNEPDE